MVYEKDIKGKFVTLRSITIDDAEFSYNLRRDPKFVNIMGQPAKSVEKQKEFIEWQRKEQGDYYFVVYNRLGIRIGLTGVYNIKGDTCEFGRELNIGAPYETMETSILILDFAKNILGLKKSKSIVYKINDKHYKMIKKLNCNKITEINHNGIPSYLLEANLKDISSSYEKIRKMISKISI